MAARPKTYITDFRDLPPLTDDEFERGRSFAAFLHGIVMIASMEGPEARVRSPIPCRCRPKRRACRGTILIDRHAGHSEVEWRCSECEFNGVVTHWEAAVAAAQPPLKKNSSGHRPPQLRLLKASGFEGRWLIEQVLPAPLSYESDTQVDLDSLGTPHFEFEQQFASVRFARFEGNMDCRYSGHQVDFCWVGDEDTKPLRGRGSARIDGGRLHGTWFTYGKADLTFVARRFREGEPMDLTRRDKLDADW